MVEKDVPCKLFFRKLGELCVHTFECVAPRLCAHVLSIRTLVLSQPMHVCLQTSNYTFSLQARSDARTRNVSIGSN